MEFAELDRWRRLSSTLASSMALDDGALRRAVERWHRDNHDALRLSGPSWPDDSRARLMRPAVVPDPGNSPRRPLGFQDAARAKAVSLAHSLLFAPADLLDPGDAVALAAIVRSFRRQWAEVRDDPGREARAFALPGPVIADVAAMRRAGPPPGPGGGVAAFACPWMPRGSQGRAAVATGTAAVSTLDPESAPVAVMLARPGGWVAVRRHGSGWLRPVTSPGGWDPVTWDAFAEAVALGSAWNDNPFVPGPRGRSAAFALRDHASGTRVSGVADRAREGDAVAASRSLAGTLHVVDGIVHRLCPEPTLHWVEQDSRETLAWVLDAGHPTGMLSMTTCLDVAPAFEAYPCAWDVDRAPRPDPAMGFGAADAPVVLAAFRDRLEWNRNWIEAPGLDTADVVRVVRPDLVEAVPGTMADTVTRMARRLSEWVDARDREGRVHGGDHAALRAGVARLLGPASDGGVGGPVPAPGGQASVADLLSAVAEAAAVPPGPVDDLMGSFSP